jgi:gliding motility-associated-like protein
LTPDSFLNLVFIAVENYVYRREVKVNACYRVDTIDIEVVPVAGIFISPQDSAVCPGETIQFVVTADPGVSDFMWMPPNGLSCTECKEPAATVFATTTYSVEGEFKGCPVGGAVTVIAKPLPAYSFPSPPFTCSGDPILLNLANDQFSTFTWTASDGSDVPDIAQPVVSPTQTTTYSFTADRDGCTVSDQVTITVPQDFTLTVAPGKTVCKGDQITLNASATQGGILFDWTASNGSPVEDIANPTVIITGPVSYTVVATDPAACWSHSETIVFDVFPDLSLSVSNDVTQPQGTQTILVASANPAGVTYAWKDNKGNNLGTTASITVAPCDTTVYTVTVTHPNGCGTLEASVTVNTLDIFDLSVSGNLTITQGEKTTLTATATLPGTTFAWKDNFGNAVGTTASITVSPCKTTSYTVTATHPNGCGTETETLIVVVADAFTIASVNLVILGNDTTGMLYEGQEYMLTVTTVPAVLSGVTYTWTVNGEVVATTADTTSGTLKAPEITDPSSDEVPITYGVLITSAEGCQNPSADETGIIKNNPVEVPNAFSPNNDQNNDRFSLVSRVPVNIVDFKVWNRWGQLVYNNEAGAQGWDGMFKNEPAPSDVYVYHIVWEIDGGDGVRTVMKGDVTLLR